MSPLRPVRPLTLTLALGLSLTFVACGGEGDGDGGGAAAPVDSTPPAGPTAAVTRMCDAVKSHQLGNIWGLLPPGHHQDVQGLLKTASTKVDGEVYNNVMATVQDLVATLKSKQDLVAETVKAKAGANLSSDVDVDRTIKNTVAMLDGLVGSERLSSVERLGGLDIGAFLNETGQKVMPAVVSMLEMQPSPDNEALLAFLNGEQEVEITERSVDGANAVLGFKLGDKAEDIRLVKVGDHWLPAEMQADWDQNMTRMRQQLASMEPMAAEDKIQVQQVLGMVNKVLADAKNAESPEELMEIVTSSPLMQMVGGMMGGMQGGQNPTFR